MPEEREAPTYKAREGHGFSIDANFSRTVSDLVLPVGVEFEDCLHPEFWVNVAHLFAKDVRVGQPDRAGATIYVRSADNTWQGELFVRAVRGKTLIVDVYREPVFFGPRDINKAGYEVRWNVGKRGFDIIRKSDRAVVEDAGKFPTKELAIRWIEDVAGIKTAA